MEEYRVLVVRIPAFGVFVRTFTRSPWQPVREGAQTESGREGAQTESGREGAQTESGREGAHSKKAGEGFLLTPSSVLPGEGRGPWYYLPN